MTGSLAVATITPPHIEYGQLSPLLLSILASAIMIMVAVWESISLRSKPQSEATSA